MKRLAAAAVVLAAVALSAWSPCEAGSAEKKYALLVGVSEYEHDGLSKLECPELDAKAIAEPLKAAGYEVDLLLGRSATKKAITEKLDSFGRRGDRAEVVVIGLFGHGVQPKDKSYLCPYDAPMRPVKGADGSQFFTKEGQPLLEPDPAGLVPLDAALTALAVGPRGARLVREKNGEEQTPLPLYTGVVDLQLNPPIMRAFVETSPTTGCTRYGDAGPPPMSTEDGAVVGRRVVRGEADILRPVRVRFTRVGRIARSGLGSPLSRLSGSCRPARRMRRDCSGRTTAASRLARLDGCGNASSEVRRADPPTSDTGAGGLPTA